MNRNIFYKNYRIEFGPLTQSQIDGLNKLLNFIEEDKHIKDIRWIAYILATVYHECARTWQPIKESGSSEYFIRRYGSQTKVGKSIGNDTPEEGSIYAGRGYSQVTGETNYERNEIMLRKEYPDVVDRFEKRTGRKFDLTIGDHAYDVNDPDNMLDPEIAYCSMSMSMRKGLYTGVGLKRYINGNGCDFYNARKIINGLDCADKVAFYAKKFLKCVKAATI